jgi:hypothetical protein
MRRRSRLRLSPSPPGVQLLDQRVAVRRTPVREQHLLKLQAAARRIDGDVREPMSL